MAKTSSKRSHKAGASGSGSGSGTSKGCSSAAVTMDPTIVPSGWMCPDCIVTLGSELLGRRVLVWWADDKVLYPGTIDAYDAASARHRVLYEDNEWEFLNLSAEPVIMSIGGSE